MHNPWLLDGLVILAYFALVISIGLYKGRGERTMEGFAVGDRNIPWWAVLALPAALVIAFAFAAVGMAATSFMRSWQDFDLVTLVILPMFLFSTTFYPITVYPRWLQIVVECLPLYHAVELMRALTTGAVAWTALVHVAYFAVMAAIGLYFASRRPGKLLLT